MGLQLVLVFYSRIIIRWKIYQSWVNVIAAFVGGSLWAFINIIFDKNNSSCIYLLFCKSLVLFTTRYNDI